MRLVSFDTETYLITDTDSAPKPVCCTWYEGTTASISHPGDMTTAVTFADPRNIYVGQNIAYDLVLMMRWHPRLIPDIIRALDEGRVFDIAMRERLIHLATVGSTKYEMFPSLLDLAAKYLNLDLSKDKQGDDIWRLKYGTLDGVPFNEWPREALAYAMDDAVHTYNVFMAQGGLQNIQPTECAQVQAAVVLQAIGVYGFAVNQSIKEKIGASLEAKAKALHKNIDKYQWTGKGSQARMQDLIQKAWQYKQFLAIRMFIAGIHMFYDENAVKQYVGTKSLRTALKEAIDTNTPIPGLTFPTNIDWRDPYASMIKGLPDPPMTKEGYSTSEETLEKLMDVVPAFADYVEMRHLEKMLKNYIEPYKYETAHPRFVPLVSTGRTGCRGGGSSANMQNIPRKDKNRPDEAFRTMFQARPGRVLGTTDYSQLELCTLAATIRSRYGMESSKLGDAIDKGIDVHCLTGGIVSGRSYEQMIEGKKAKDPDVLMYRQGAKAANFGLPGGLSAPALVRYAETQYGVKFSIQEGFKWVNAWKKAWPEIPNQYLSDHGKWCNESDSDSFTAWTLTGRPKAYCSYTEGSNYPFQGLAADGAKAALYGIWREEVLGWYWSRTPGMGYGCEYRDSPLRDSHIVNFIHDEIVNEHPAGDLGKAALKRQDEIMISEMTRICQNLIRISVESKLSDAWEH